ncbi:hypothetical protein LXA43DRAFT_1067569 [Ganoderma leucocontextum]|nr:hypothetical protein LXA43DRAFT_1067569 [Ganoderma leucocontextum]
MTLFEICPQIHRHFHHYIRVICTTRRLCHTECNRDGLDLPAPAAHPALIENSRGYQKPWELGVTCSYWYTTSIYDISTWSERHGSYARDTAVGKRERMVQKMVTHPSTTVTSRRREGGEDGDDGAGMEQQNGQAAKMPEASEGSHKPSGSSPSAVLASKDTLRLLRRRGKGEAQERVTTHPILMRGGTENARDLACRGRPEGGGEAGATVATREQDVKSERGGQYGRMDTDGSIVAKSAYDRCIGYKYFKLVADYPSPLFLYAGPSTSLLQALMAADDRDNTSLTSSSSSWPKLKPRVELRLKAHEQLTSTKWDNSRWFFALLPCPSASSLLVIVNCVTQAKKEWFFLMWPLEHMCFTVLLMRDGDNETESRGEGNGQWEMSEGNEKQEMGGEGDDRGARERAGRGR